jgi:hypothetical protein
MAGNATVVTEDLPVRVSAERWKYASSVNFLAASTGGKPTQRSQKYTRLAGLCENCLNPGKTVLEKKSLRWGGEIGFEGEGAPSP